MTTKKSVKSKSAAKTKKKTAGRQAAKKAPARKAAKRAVKKIAPKKATIAATKSVSFTPKDLEKLKKTMQETSIPKEIREVLDAASKGNFDAFNNKVQSLSAQRLNELVRALDWSSETGIEALEKLGKDAQVFKDGVLGNELPDVPTLVKCCCDRRIFPHMCKLCGCLFCRCHCCGCGCGCSWDDFCHHVHCHCCRGIPVYSGVATASKLARSLRFTDDFTVTFPTTGQAQIDFNVGTHDHDARYYTESEIDGRKNTITIKADFTIATTDTYPYVYDLSALTCAYGDIHVSVSGVHGAAASTALSSWLRFTWSVDTAKKLFLHIWDQAGAECDPTDPAWDGTDVHLKITAIG